MALGERRRDAPASSAECQATQGPHDPDVALEEMGRKLGHSSVNLLMTEEKGGEQALTALGRWPKPPDRISNLLSLLIFCLQNPNANVAWREDGLGLCAPLSTLWDLES
jgi:hypothetical protein